ncbi:hypothetical protein DEO72_LG2g3550 [Vigna unguiculata]|uniref:Uncharacterized protein n=1 Tax=Vigna unguiculata TaxID=3917 RepID=A0A4D6L3W1_VIGUN|nr:hypothetical protein DEO72_LG2g3550 [Vigna unguiculata]
MHRGVICGYAILGVTPQQWVCERLAPGDKGVPLGGLGRFCLAALRLRQAITLQSMACLCDVLTERYYTWIGKCCAMSGTTSGEVRRAGLQAGRFIEAGARTASSPFLFVFGDDRVIRYTGADNDTGDAEDAQATE